MTAGNSQTPNWSEWRDAIIGLGDKSVRKSYYPQLLQRIDDLQESQKNMRELLNSMYDAVIVHDIDGNIFEVNNTFLSLYRLRREDFPACTIQAILPEINFIELMQGIAKRIADNDSNVLNEFRTQRPLDGSQFDVDMATRTVQWYGRSLFISSLRDITERKRIEQEREQMMQEIQRHKADLERFLYVFGHDMRSPLLSLQGFSGEIRDQIQELMECLRNKDSARLETLVQKDIAESLRFILLATQKLSQHIDGMLRMGRMGQAVLQLESIDCNALIQEQLDAIHWQLNETQAEIVVSPLPPCLGDRQWISQVFGNMLDNALKYRSSQRPLRVKILGSREEGFAVYEFIDNGQGIKAEILPHIWDLFFRGVSKDGPAGEGLGLTMVHQIVERHGGQIQVESQAGSGSRFIIRLPLPT